MLQKKIVENDKEENYKGIALERDAHQFLWDLGYLVYSRLNLYAIRQKISEYGESYDKIKVTDLDIYGILFGKYLEKNTFLIDCKHRSEQIFSQILRCKGILTILEINHLLILRESVPETVQQFADSFNIRLLNIGEFSKRIKKREKGSFSLKTYSRIEDFSHLMDKVSKTFEVTLSNSYLEKDPFRRIKILRNLYNLIKDDIKHQKEEKFSELKYYQILRVFQFSLITIAEIASLTIHLSSYHFKNYVNLKLIGNIEFKKQIFSKIKIIEEGINHEKKPSIPLNTLTPSYSEEINEQVNEFRQKPYLVQKYLRFIDFIIHEYFIHKKEINEIEIKKEFGNINRILFAKWNIKSLEILDDDKIYPSILSKFLS